MLVRLSSRVCYIYTNSYSPNILKNVLTNRNLVIWRRSLNENVKPVSDAKGTTADVPPNDNSEQTQINDLLKALDELKQNRDELNDKYMRSLAENENIRKRLMKQIDEAKLFGIQKFCKDLLQVADVLSQATECVPKTEITDNNPHLKNLYEGLKMTESILKSVFAHHGLTLLSPLDEKFDPNFHEALFEQEVEGKEPGTVVVVSKAGYKLHDRVIRPALVGVSKSKDSIKK